MEISATGCDGVVVVVDELKGEESVVCRKRERLCRNGVVINFSRGEGTRAGGGAG